MLAEPTQAQGQGAVSERFPLALTLDASACAGELIDIEGTLHTVNHVVETAEGYHAQSHFNLVNVKGVGQTTGEEYVIPASGTVVQHVIPPSGTEHFGSVDINLAIRKGDGTLLGDDQVFFSRVHYIIDDEGTLKVETIQFHFKCH